MKKIATILLALTAFLMVTSPAYGNWKINSVTYVDVKEIRLPPIPPAGRSLAPKIEVVVDADSNLIQVDFHCNLGALTILVVNQMGQTITRYNCNTDFEPMAILSMPMDEGFYTIRIIGSEYEAEGYFTL